MTVGVWCNVTTVIVTGRASCGSIQTISNYSSKFLISNLQAAAELMAHCFNLLHSTALSCPVFFKTRGLL